MFNNRYVFVVVLLAGLLASPVVQADDPGLGMLMLGNDQPALLLATKLEVDVNGPLANVRLIQEFFNPGSDYSSAKYVFPLPENAAVHAMQMQIGERVIEGSIAEKQAAQRIYTTAKANGQQAALTEKLSSNVFQTRIAHVAAGDQISVELSYREVLEPDGDHFSLRIPTTFTPRYWAAQLSPQNQMSANRHNAVVSQNDSYAVPVFTANYQSTESMPLEQVNILSLDMRLQPGLPVIDVSSSSHALAVQQDSFNTGESYTLSLLDGFDMMDRDFLVSWQLAPAAQPRTVIMREQFTDATGMSHEYGLFMLQPPSPDYYQASKMSAGLSREVVFIVDRSGSMGGDSILQAKASLAYALDSLNQTDRFNIIDFSDAASQFAERPQSASPNHIADALEYIHSLNAGGGTNMQAALDLAFSTPASNGYLRQVVFITDGAVGDEQNLLKLINEKIGDARLFSVSIGSAPNSFFMRKAAQIGRGSMHQVAADDDLQVNMDILLAQLVHPALTDIEFGFLDDGAVVTMERQYLPDLYLGEPLMFTARFDQWPDSLQLTGFDGAPWQHQLELGEILPYAEGVAALWGKHRTDELYDNLMLGGSKAVLRPQIVDIALAHQLLTPFTSFVAVEQKIANHRADGDAEEKQLANHLPANNQMQLPATGMGLNTLYVLLILAFALWCWGLPWQRIERATA